MEVVNSAEKEASEVLHSLLSVERRTGDSKENIINVTIPSQIEASWHIPVTDNSSIFALSDGDLQSGEFTAGGQQVLWQGHTIQIQNVTSVNDASETILQELYPIVSVADNETMAKIEPEIEKKPPVKKTPAKKAKKMPSSGDDEGLESDDRNKLEDNPLQVKARLKKGCDCKDNCYRGLLPENVYKHRLNIAELTKSEHDMYLMGLTMACLANPLETSRHKARRRLRASYVYQGRRVCLEAFLYLENVTHYQLKRIRHHVMTHGVAPRVHGNMGKKPYNTFSLDIYKHATEFLKQYLEQHLQGISKDPTKTVFLQGDTRRNLYDAYREYGEYFDGGSKLMGYSTFRCFMKDQFPNVKFLPKTVDKTKEVFKSGKCMTYDKNKDPVRIKAEKEKADAKKRLLAQKKQAAAGHQNISLISNDQQQPPQVIVQPQIQVQVSQNQQVQQVQTIQQVAQHQMVQQMNVQTVNEDTGNGQQMEITQQVIPLTVVQQPQQTYIVTPVSHLQTSVHGGWYRQ